MVVSIRENNHKSCTTLAQTIIAALRNNGFALIYPNVYDSTLTEAVLETTAAVNGSLDTDRWRIYINAINKDKLRIVVGTDIQLSNTGTITLNADKTINGHIGTTVGTVVTEFIDRTGYGSLDSYLMSCHLVIASQGIGLCVWEVDALQNTTPAPKPYLSYIVIQRPVNNRTGAIRTTGKAPVFCLYGINRDAIDIANKLVVRESDISRPTESIPANIDTEDSFKIIGTKQMVAMTEDMNYIIFFPNRLNTQRYAYPQDDLDLLGYSSSGIVSSGSTLLMYVYSEPTARKYAALASTQLDSTGIVIFLLSQ